GKRRAPGIAVAQRQNLVISREQPRREDRRLVGFGARVEQERLRRLAVFLLDRREVAEPLHERDGALVQIERRRVSEPLGLLADRVRHLGMAVAHADREDAAEEVEELASL